MKQVELLAPAKNIETAIAAIIVVQMQFISERMNLEREKMHLIPYRHRKIS